ncbi:MAG: DUF4474 domain-containing protein [Clostridia bacterium]|nr:DUF4474 domain-containing protein [Clostridia bacterium]
MKKTAIRFIALFFALLMASSTVFAVSAAVIEEQSGVSSAELIGEILSADGVLSGAATPTEPKPETENKTPAIMVSCESMTVVIGKTVQMKAEIINSDSKTQIFWESSDKNVATVGANGVVKGVAAGRATITAKATVEGKQLKGEYVICVITRSNVIKDVLEDEQVLSYQYSYIDDYYYTNDKDCWQYHFGFGKLYDLAAPYILMEYDYVRIFFTYEEKDWMIQLWKGQYGLLFYGGEIGVYNKEHTGEEDTVLTFYECPPEEDWLKMEMSLYHDDGTGNYVREFTRDYGDYWWCTGFKDGHLRNVEPADELRMVSRITFKDAEMAKLFSDGLIECGFKQGSSKDGLALDQFCTEGSDVYVRWQNISEAENTMPIKIGMGTLVVINFMSIILMLLAFIAMAGMGGLLLLLFI